MLTVATKSVLLTLIVDADEKQDVAIVDISNAFIQTQVEDKKDWVIIRIRGVVVDWLTKIAPKVYTQYVSADRKGGKTLLVECRKNCQNTITNRKNSLVNLTVEDVTFMQSQN